MPGEKSYTTTQGYYVLFSTNPGRQRPTKQ